MAARNYTTLPFVSVIEGRKIKKQSCPTTKSNTSIRSTMFDEITEDIKKASDEWNRDYIFPRVDSSLNPYSQFCLPSPLENSPLTGKAIGIRGKGSPVERMWRPSDSAPVNYNCDVMDNRGPDIVQTKFQKKPWSDLLRLSWLQAYRSNLEDKAYATDSLAPPAEVRSSETIFDRLLPLPSIRVSKNSQSFIPETGKRHESLPRNRKIGNDTRISISGHEPTKTRQAGTIPVLSVFNLFQSEYISDSAESESLNREEQALELPAGSNEDCPCFPKEEGLEENVVFCSIISTRASTLPLGEDLLEDDVDEESSTKKIDFNSQSQQICSEEIKNDVPCADGQDEGQSGLKTWPAVSVPENKSCVSKDNESELEVEEVCIPADEYEALNLTDVSEVSSNYEIQKNHIDMDSADFMEGCAFYEANIQHKQINTMEVPRTESTLKRRPQSRFMFSKIATGQIQSKDREGVMQRLTKQYVRGQSISQKFSHAENNTFHCGDVTYPSSVLRELQAPKKNQFLSTINLKLDFMLQQKKVMLPTLISRSRLLRKYYASRKNFQAETSQDDSAKCTLRDFFDGVSTYANPSRLAQVVFVRKGVFNEVSYDFINTGGMLIHGQGLQTSANGNNDSFETKTVGSEWQMQCPVNEVGSSEAKISDCESVAPWYPQGHSVAVTKATYCPNLEESSSSYPVHLNRTLHFVDCLNNFSNVTETPENSEGRTIDHVSEVTPDDDVDKCRKEINIRHSCLRSASSRAYSATSIDHVPCNSPVESSHCIFSQQDSLTYINDAAHCKIQGLPVRSREATSRDDVYSCHNLEANSRHSMYSCHRREANDPDDLYSYQRREVYTHSANYNVQSTHDEGVLSEKCLNSDQDALGNLLLQHNLTGQDNLKHNRSPEELHIPSEQGNDVGNAVTSCVPDLSPRSLDNEMSFSDESLLSDKISQSSKFDNDSDEEIDNNALGIDSDTHLPTETTRGHNSALQHNVMEHLVLDKNNLQCSGTSSSAFKSCIYDDKSKEKTTSADRREVGPVYKNVRFADVDNIISFRNNEQTASNTVPQVVYRTPLPNINTSHELKRHRLPVRVSPCMYKQVPHLGTSSRYGCSQPLKKIELDNSPPRYCTTECGPVKSNRLKWSSYNYKKRAPDSGTMCVTGRRLAAPGATHNTRASEEGGPVTDHLFVCDDSVMYTICQKCKDELHIKFGSTCCQENG